jgi:hypothetical protein
MNRRILNRPTLPLTLNLLGALCLASTAAAQPTSAIQRLTLDPMAVTRIPVATDRLTTLRFPSPVSDLQSALVAAEPHPDALFLLTFQPGNAFFSVRALVPGTNTTLNVVWKNQTCVLELVESRSPWLSVIFDAPAEPATNAPPKPMTTARLLGLLDTAKAYSLLRMQHPESVAGVEVARPGSVRDGGDYTVRLEEVFRFEAEDTLVFRVALSNKLDTVLRYLPESLMVKAGQRVFYQSIAEGDGTVPAASEVPVYFAITGSADGSRNALSPKNDFQVLFSRLDVPRPPPPPVVSAAPPPEQRQPSRPQSLPAGFPVPSSPVGEPVFVTNGNCISVVIRPRDPCAPRPAVQPVPVVPGPAYPIYTGADPCRPIPNCR